MNIKPERRKYIKDWKSKNRERVRAHWREWWDKNKDTALLKVGRGKLACRRCGSTKRDWLEINHINGGGNKERREKGLRGVGFKRAIIFGRRSVDDLEILCKPCNMVDAAERMSGKKYMVVN